MNLKQTKHPMTAFDKEASLSGMGANVIWNGPFDSTALPKGKGSSSGITGIIMNNDKPECKGGSIMQRIRNKY